MRKLFSNKNNIKEKKDTNSQPLLNEQFTIKTGKRRSEAFRDWKKRYLD